MEFPKIKRSVLEFVSNEDGRITHDSLIKLGAISLLTAGMATSASALTRGESPSGKLAWEYDEVAKDYIKVTCYDSIENGGDHRVFERLLLLELQFDAQFGGEHLDIFSFDRGIDRQHDAKAQERLLHLHRANAGRFRETANCTGQFEGYFSLSRCRGVRPTADQRASSARRR